MRFHRLFPAAILFTLVLTTFATSQAQSHSTESTLPYIYSTDTFPSYRATVARHTLRLAIPTDSQSISALKLTAPDGFTLDKRVEVFNNKTGEKLPVNVNIEGKTVELSFNRAIQPGTAINVELNNVGVWGLARNYSLAAKFVTLNQDKSGVSSESRYINLGKTDLRRS
jgi:Protein of unknown function (DUF2808)